MKISGIADIGQACAYCRCGYVARLDLKRLVRERGDMELAQLRRAMRCRHCLSFTRPDIAVKLGHWRLPPPPPPDRRQANAERRNRRFMNRLAAAMLQAHDEQKRDAEAEPPPARKAA